MKHEYGVEILNNLFLKHSRKQAAVDFWAMIIGFVPFDPINFEEKIRRYTFETHQTNL